MFQTVEILRILCAECFNQIVDIKKGIAKCSCGAEYNIAEKATHFKIRLSGGFIKSNLLFDDVASGIKTGAILPDDYIASSNGPWIHVYDSSFEEYFKIIKDSKSSSGIILYEKKKRKISLISTLSMLLIISIAINFTLVVLLYMMSNKVTNLIKQITGG